MQGRDCLSAGAPDLFISEWLAQTAFNRGVATLESNRDGLHELIQCVGDTHLKNIGCIVLQTPLEPMPTNYYPIPNGAGLFEALDQKPMQREAIIGTHPGRSLDVFTWKPTEASFSRYIYRLAQYSKLLHLSGKEVLTESWRWRAVGLGAGVSYEALAQSGAVPSFGEQVPLIGEWPYVGAAAAGVVAGKLVLASTAQLIQKERILKALKPNPPVRVRYNN